MLDKYLPNHVEDEAWINWQNAIDLYYDENYSSSAQAFVMNTSHRIVEAPLKNLHFERVLEIGAGTGKHFEFIKHRFVEYTVSDANLKMLEQAKKNLARYNDPRIKFAQYNGENISVADSSYDRIVAMHVLEHLPNPHLCIKEWLRVVKNGGMISCLIPTDPGLMWRIGRAIGPRRKALRAGLNYDYIMAREHINSCTNLIAFFEYYFKKSNVCWWPLKIPTPDLNLFAYINFKVEK